MNEQVNSSFLLNRAIRKMLSDANAYSPSYTEDDVHELFMRSSLSVYDARGSIAHAEFGVASLNCFSSNPTWPLCETCLAYLSLKPADPISSERIWVRLVSIASFWPQQGAFLRIHDTAESSSSWSEDGKTVKGKSGTLLQSLGSMSGGDPINAYINGERRIVLNTKVPFMFNLIGPACPGWAQVVSIPVRYADQRHPDTDLEFIVTYSVPVLRMFGELGGKSGRLEKLHSGNPYFSELYEIVSGKDGAICVTQGENAIKHLASYSEG
ncbi:MAG: hypothetical protein ACF8MJ_06570 [Phycisphaerales bacterium JB050]